MPCFHLWTWLDPWYSQLIGVASIHAMHPSKLIRSNPLSTHFWVNSSIPKCSSILGRVLYDVIRSRKTHLSICIKVPTCSCYISCLTYSCPHVYISLNVLCISVYQLMQAYCFKCVVVVSVAPLKKSKWVEWNSLLRYEAACSWPWVFWVPPLTYGSRLSCSCICTVCFFLFKFPTWLLHHVHS